MTDLRVVATQGSDRIVEDAVVEDFAAALRGRLLLPDEERAFRRYRRPVRARHRSPFALGPRSRGPGTLDTTLPATNNHADSPFWPARGRSAALTRSRGTRRPRW